MKQLVFTLLFLLLSFSAFSQKKDYPTYETVFTTSDFESYWVYGAGLNIHPIDTGDVPILELSTGWVFNNDFMMGISGGFGMIELARRMNQIELWADKMFRPNKAVHPILSISGGYSRQFKNLQFWRLYGVYSQNAYTVNPMVGFQFNLWEQIRVDTRVGYNIVLGTAQDQIGIGATEINSLTFSTQILFGKFASFGN